MLVSLVGSEAVQPGNEVYSVLFLHVKQKHGRTGNLSDFVKRLACQQELIREACLGVACQQDLLGSFMLARFC